MKIKKNFILVADLYDFTKYQIKNLSLISVFPFSKNDKALRLTYDQLLDRSINQTALFQKLTLSFNKEFRQLFKEIKVEHKLLIYPFVAATFSIILDRYIRVKERINQLDSSIEIIRFDSKLKPKSLNDILSLSSQNFDFNQKIINSILVANGFRFSNKSLPIKKNTKIIKIKNFIFHENLKNALFKKIVNKFITIFDWIFPSKSKIFSLGLNYDEIYFRIKGLYGKFGIFKKTKLIINDYESLINIKLRENLKLKLSVQSQTLFTNFFNHHHTNLNKKDIKILSDLWIDTFFLFYPTSFLEDIKKNYEYLHQSNFSNCEAVIFNENYSNDNLLLFAYLKYRKKKLIGLQHGAGYYGYINDWSLTAHFEYKLYDILITHGWSKFERHLPSCQAIPLAAPSLSELDRNIRIEYHLKPIDIIYMPSIFHRFPHPSTNGHSRIDFIDDIKDLEINTIKMLKKFFSIHYKPYNYNQLNLQKNHKKNLEKLISKNFSFANIHTKGLSEEITNNYSLILWDSLGSGAIECFIAKVPTLIYWKKIYSVPSTFSKSIINELEKSGIIHTNAKSLINEIFKFKQNPDLWIKNYLNNKYIKIFCDNFAKTNRTWDHEWLKFFKSFNRKF